MDELSIAPYHKVHSVAMTSHIFTQLGKPKHQFGCTVQLHWENLFKKPNVNISTANFSLETMHSRFKIQWAHVTMTFDLSA